MMVLMTASVTWPHIHAARTRLADALADLTYREWSAPSWCSGFTTRDVVAHLTAGASLTPVRWFAGVVRCGFDFDKQVEFRLRQQLGESPAETYARFVNTISNTTAPPLPKAAMLGEVIVHGEDILAPLGHTSPEHPMRDLTAVARFYAGSNLMLPSRDTIRDLRLVADDGPFRVGSGPKVRGNTLHLVLAMTGRPGALPSLTGPGLESLTGRVTPG